MLYGKCQITHFYMDLAIYAKKFGIGRVGLKMPCLGEYFGVIKVLSRDVRQDI